MNGTVTTTTPAAVPPALAADLFASFLTPEGWDVLAVAAECPSTPKRLAVLTGLGKSGTYAVLADLRGRGLVADTDAGYALSDAGSRLWPLLSAAGRPADGRDAP